MTYVNVGARLDTGEGEPARVRTKKALREALAGHPCDVHFDNTSVVIVTGQQREYRASELPAGYRFQVVGPDPYADRKWYATVELKDGTPKVTA